MTTSDPLVGKEVPVRIAYFMKAGGQNVPDHPKVPEQSVQDMRLDLIEEETEELRQAYADRNIEEIVDSALDLAVVAIGGALDAAPAQAVTLCLKTILRANEAKIGSDGTVRRREDGKILKPEGWKPPELRAILRLYDEDEKSLSEVLEGLDQTKKVLGEETDGA